MTRLVATPLRSPFPGNWVCWTWPRRRRRPLRASRSPRGDLGQALGYVEAILGHVAAGGSMDASFELLRIQYTCYQVLAAAHDTRADALLGTARTMLEERAARFTDPQARRRFENITQHREIANAWRFAGFKSS